MKHQTPITKPQRSSNTQSSNGRGARSVSGHHILDKLTLRVSEIPDDTTTARHPFDLEERTARFGEAIIRFAKKIPRSLVNNRLIDQLVGCSTSVGGNYCEADERVSKKDFRTTIGRCAKEAKETKFFLRMTAAAEPNLAEEARQHFMEAKALHLIFASIYRK